jgi:hypothetical protein
MANGTIAFDTLTTSDSVNTGTEKSIDTSYIFNGVNKAWVHYDSSTVANDSFNIASLTDDGTGDTTHNLTNSMTNADFAAYGAFDRMGSNINSFLVEAHTTSNVGTRTQTGSGILDVASSGQLVFTGDLA